MYLCWGFQGRLLSLGFLCAGSSGARLVNERAEDRSSSSQSVAMWKICIQTPQWNFETEKCKDRESSEPQPRLDIPGYQDCPMNHKGKFLDAHTTRGFRRSLRMTQDCIPIKWSQQYIGEPPALKGMGFGRGWQQILAAATGVGPTCWQQGPMHNSGCAPRRR